jgi:hypothetical protein
MSKDNLKEETKDGSSDVTNTVKGTGSWDETTYTNAGVKAVTGTGAGAGF